MFLLSGKHCNLRTDLHLQILLSDAVQEEWLHHWKIHQRVQIVKIVSWKFTENQWKVNI